MHIRRHIEIANMTYIIPASTDVISITLLPPRVNWCIELYIVYTVLVHVYQHIYLEIWL